jgi:hypothetical protein
MDKIIDLSEMIPVSGRTSDRDLALFSFINMGLIDAMMNGVMSAEGAAQIFYNADNRIYVKEKFKEKIADKIMSHGVQLPDVFDALPAGEAHREFLRELATIRNLCLKLLEDHRLVA